MNKTLVITVLIVVFLITAITLPTVPWVYAEKLHPGDLLVTETGGGGMIIQVDPVTGAQEIISSGGSFVLPIDLVLDANGDIIVVDVDAFGGNGAIIRVDPNTGIQTTVSSGDTFRNPNGVAIDSNGDIFVTDLDGFEEPNGRITKVDPITGVQTVISSGGSFFIPAGIVIDDNDDILVADLNTVIKVDSGSGAQETISSDFDFNPLDLTLDVNGDIIVSTIDLNIFGGGNLVRVDPLTGSQTTITSGGFIESLSGVTVDANGNFILADVEAFEGTGAIIRVDPTTGSQTLISSGGFFIDPSAVLVVPQAENENEKIVICHKEKMTKSVSENAVPAHLNHGDTLGPCE